MKANDVQGPCRLRFSISASLRLLVYRLDLVLQPGRETIAGAFTITFSEILLLDLLGFILAELLGAIAALLWYVGSCHPTGCRK